MLFLALLAGLFLSRHAASCFIGTVADYEIGAVVDDKTNTALVDDSGVVRDGIEGDYAENVNRGTGIFGYVFDAAGMCVETSSFSHPLPVKYAFLALFGLGMLFMFLERFITPNWQSTVREQGDKTRQRQEEENTPDLVQRRPPSARKRDDDIKPIEVDLEGFGAPPSGATLGNSYDDLPAMPSSPEPGGSLRTNSIGLSSTLDAPRRDLTASPEEALADDDPFGFKTDDPFDFNSRTANDLADSQASPALSRPRGSRLSGASRRLDDITLQGEEGTTPSGSHRGVVPMPSGASAELSSTFKGALADFRHSDSGSRFDDFALADTVLPDEEDDAFGLAQEEQSKATWVLPSDVWSPPNWKRGPVIYVAPSSSRGGRSTGKSPGEPLFGLAEALVVAQELVDGGHRVQLRLLPGLYEERVTLPPRVAMINHRLPPVDDDDALRDWLQAGDESSEVVMAAPSRIGAEDYVLNLDGSHDAWVVGIRFAGSLPSESQPRRYGGAAHVLSTRSARFYLCTFAGHRSTGDGAAIRMEDGGDLKKKTSIQIERCLFEDNHADGRGGAVFAQESITVLRECMFRGNHSRVAGGALFVHEARIPMLIEDSVICDNKVEIDDELPDASRSGWSGEVGHGGGIYASYSGLHLRRCDLLGNQSVGAGGAIFAFASRLLLEGNTEDDGRPLGRIAENQALRGGAILLSGLRPDGDMERFLTALRATGIEFSRNKAHESGGAIATFRMVALDLKDGICERNVVSAEYGEGGAIHATVGSRLKLTRMTISKNRAPFRGGGLSVCNSSLRIFEGCVVRENQSERGEFAGIAFYTMFSRLLDDLQTSKKLEVPVVCAIAPCEITRNRSKGGVAGLFIGCLEDKPSVPIVYAIKDPELIANNVVARVVAQRKLGPRPPGRRRPENIMVVWAKRVMANDTRLPEGKQSLHLPSESVHA
ncbi:MAG: hypothetical protein CMH57_09470 [Myxococcales bacterium]|nr:hypothetical protein [Myxococcales bacterium]